MSACCGFFGSQGLGHRLNLEEPTPAFQSCEQHFTCAIALKLTEISAIILTVQRNLELAFENRKLDLDGLVGHQGFGDEAGGLLGYTNHGSRGLSRILAVVSASEVEGHTPFIT